MADLPAGTAGFSSSVTQGWERVLPPLGEERMRYKARE
jgi:hypothetical protein